MRLKYRAAGAATPRNRGRTGRGIPAAALLGLAVLILAGCGGGGKPRVPDMPEYAAGKTYLLQQETLRRHAAAVRTAKERLALQHARQRAAKRDIVWERLRRVLDNPANRLDHDGA